jgi:hypothetical protein
MKLVFALAITFALWFVAINAAPAAIRWPTPQQLQRCEVPFDKMKDARLRRWCVYWSKRLP